MAYFCTVTGARIVAPGVCKAVDPVNGQDECNEGDPEPKPRGKSADAPKEQLEHHESKSSPKGAK